MFDSRESIKAGVYSRVKADLVEELRSFD